MSRIGGFGVEKNDRPDDDGFAWHDAREIGVEGKGFADTAGDYDRLPGRAREMVRTPVWELAQDSAGLCVHFGTDAQVIAARWKLRSDVLSMPHMAAVAVSGLDLYARDPDGRWRWAGIGRPANYPVNQQELVAGLPLRYREFRLYLPLYNGLRKLEIGVPMGASFTPIDPRAQRSIVFYGTSIVQGACASRPGMAYPAMLGRRLDRPTINLGFSGNGRMQSEVARFVADINPAVFVLDALPNMTAHEVEANAETFIRALHKARPETPIVLVEDRTYADALFVVSHAERNTLARAALRKIYERLVDDGVTGLHYVQGDGLLGDDGEATVDGSHPNDLGFARIADALEPVLRPLLG